MYGTKQLNIMGWCGNVQLMGSNIAQEDTTDSTQERWFKLTGGSPRATGMFVIYDSLAGKIC